MGFRLRAARGVAAGFLPLATVVWLACSSSSSSNAPIADDAAPSGSNAPDAGKDATPLHEGGSDPDACTMPSTTPATRWCDLPPSCDPVPMVPDGFCARKLNDGDALSVPVPRVIRFAPNGDVFLASPGNGTPGGAAGGIGAILVLPDDDKDGRADQIYVYAGKQGSTSCSQEGADPTTLTCVHGLAFAGGYLYYTRQNDVRRFPYTKGDRVAPTDAGELVATIPMEGGDLRWTHGLDVAADGSLVVSRGRYDSTTCGAGSMEEGAVLRFPLDTLPSTPATIAFGFRNPMYVRCDAAHGSCWTNELTGDSWDGIGGREKLVPLLDGDNWGYPCCVTKDVPVPGTDASFCTNVGAEAVSIALHDTPFGLDFEPGKWPAPYANAIFLALHGAVGSWVGTRVVYVPTDASGAPSSTMNDFAAGWGHDPSGIVGRATDLAFSPDGRLFVIDDTGGGVYWIAPVDLPIPP